MLTQNISAFTLGINLRPDLDFLEPKIILEFALHILVLHISSKNSEASSFSKFLSALVSY
jgi:hypothetical protein